MISQSTSPFLKREKNASDAGTIGGRQGDSLINEPTTTRRTAERRCAAPAAGSAGPSRNDGRQRDGVPRLLPDLPDQAGTTGRAPRTETYEAACVHDGSDGKGTQDLRGRLRHRPCPSSYRRSMIPVSMMCIFPLA